MALLIAKLPTAPRAITWAICQPKPKKVRKQRSQGKPYAEDVQPHRRLYGSGVLAIVVAQLQKHRGQPDGSDNHHCQWTKESIPLGVHHDYTQAGAK